MLTDTEKMLLICYEGKTYEKKKAIFKAVIDYNKKNPINNDQKLLDEREIGLVKKVVDDPKMSPDFCEKVEEWYIELKKARPEDWSEGLLIELAPGSQYVQWDQKQTQTEAEKRKQGGPRAVWHEEKDRFTRFMNLEINDLEQYEAAKDNPEKADKLMKDRAVRLGYQEPNDAGINRKAYYFAISKKGSQKDFYLNLMISSADANHLREAFKADDRGSMEGVSKPGPNKPPEQHLSTATSMLRRFPEIFSGRNDQGKEVSLIDLIGKIADRNYKTSATVHVDPRKLNNVMDRMEDPRDVMLAIKESINHRAERGRLIEKTRQRDWQARSREDWGIV